MEAAATGGVLTSFRSILDKPLNQLTEDDISQLTREDCRKYLKEKGMRRPSWNKSQAIQQVISLKALLETTDDSGAGVFSRILVSKPAPLGASNYTDKAVSGVISDDGASCGRNDLSKADCQLAESLDDTTAVDLGTSEGWQNVSLEQMTIFYSGKVNVYEGVPPDKVMRYTIWGMVNQWHYSAAVICDGSVQAHAIMHLAASPNQLSRDGHVASTTFLSPAPLCSSIYRTDTFCGPGMGASSRQTEKCIDHPKDRRDKGNASIDLDVESPACRKVSLQRYLEKKKERGRSKTKKSFVFPSGIDVYWNPFTNSEISGDSLKNVTKFPTQSRDSEQVNVAYFIDLNSDRQEFWFDIKTQGIGCSK